MLGKKEIVRLLLEACEDYDKISVDGESPLRSAVNEGHEDVVLLLLAAGANKNSKNKSGETLLCCAIKRN